jgi:hypothetical protein
MSSPERPRAGSGRPRRVAGLPGDLLRLVRRLGEPTGGEVAAHAYLPEDLTRAYLDKGVELGALRRDREGRFSATLPGAPLTLTAAPVDTLAELDRAPGARPGAKSLRTAALALLRRHQEVERDTRVLALGGGDGLGLCLATAGAAVLVVGRNEPSAPLLERHRVPLLGVDPRFVRGFPFGAFGLVLGWQQLDPIDETMMATARANVAVYGAHYVGVDLGGRDRSALAPLLEELETHFVVTDVVEQPPVALLRAVKLPEARGNAEFVRYYVR